MLIQVLLSASLALLGPSLTAHGASADGDAIFAVGDGGALEPIAVHRGTGFMPPGSIDGGPSASLAKAANAAIEAAGNRVHVLFGGRVVATVPAKVENGGAQIAVPPSLQLAGHVSALASPTLGGYATSPRRAPTPIERSAALAVAAARLGTMPAGLFVRNLTAIVLGYGTAIVGSVDARGGGTPRTDKRLFFTLERIGGRHVLTLAHVMKITVTEPLLEEPAEYLVDALDLGHHTPALVTSIIGYDANTFAIYTRTPQHTWKQIYTGGGAAL
jgi:hypothetical protein